MTPRTRIFLSHSSQDDDFVRGLQQTLADQGQELWIDSRELRGGELLWSEIQKAIEEAAAFAVVVSPEGLQSKWLGMELFHALEIRKRRGIDKRPIIIPLSLNGTKLGVLEQFFGEEPAYIPVSSEAGGIDAAVHHLLVALGKRLPTDVPPTPQPKAEPLEELVLELTDLKFQEQNGVQRASARARLVYEPATSGQPKVQSEKNWRFIAPINHIEAEELRWYLEKYAIWPNEIFRQSAAKVEQNLIVWGRQLYAAAMPLAYRANVLHAWARIQDHAGRRFSVYVDTTLEANATAAETETAREVATLLLGLPWELLHDGDRFLFQGATPTRVRRRLPNTRVLDVPVVATPIRVLLISARPEDDACDYIDHRESALPLVAAMEALGGLVQLQVLNPPTLPALRAELDRARREKKPYHVVHFDGHGVYDKQVGLGGLCFEDPQDIGKLEKRRHLTLYTNELGPLLSAYRIPLVFLEACQSAQSEKASESVASELLKVGVASVVAMSHSVLVETARRFVEVFYQALAGGKRVGDAMLAGQRALKDDNFRGRVLGAGDLRLEDWFVPVLFQEKDDPQLFRVTPAKQTVADFQAGLVARLGELPPEPATGFIGRSRELLALERLLRPSPSPQPLSQGERGFGYAVIRGQGGEGKTALAAEFARWMVRSHQVRRAAFVSVESHGHVAAVLDALGRQLIARFSVATFPNLEQAILAVERALVEQPTLLVVDNLESILPPPYLDSPEALADDLRRELDAILVLCKRLNASGETRLVFTSREALPAPFDGKRQRRELHQLALEDAVKLVERVLNQADGADHATLDAAREAIEQLVDAVHGHARTLALLAPSLQSRGVEATRLALVELMAEMARNFPDSREQSLFAGVELSLRRLSPANRDKARVLGVFHGGVQLGVLRLMMGWEEAEVYALAGELLATGLATLNPYGHLTLNPALCPYLRGRLDAEERGLLRARWGEAMRGYVELLLVQHRGQEIEIAATLTRLELPNLFAWLEQVERARDAAATIDLATSLFQLLHMTGRPRLLERVARAREAAAQILGATWNRARFNAQATQIEQQLGSGVRGVRAALEGARALLKQARAVGDQAYPDADYDLALACWLLARALRTIGGAEPALPLLDEARGRFEAIARERASQAAETMASVCLAERGDCLRNLGRFDAAATAYEENIRRAEKLGNDRSVAVGKGQLGTLRLQQRRYPEALQAYQEARERFTRLGEARTVATIWHQTGIVYQQMGQPDAAEAAYRQSLAMWVRLGDVAGQAGTLGQLGNLYDDQLDRTEEAVAFLRQAADKCVELRDVASEGRQRNNLAISLRKLRRFDEARQEIRRAIECQAPFGHATEPWLAWSNLADIETDTDTGHPAAALEARRKAINLYLAYRRDGGENHSGIGRFCFDVTERLLAGDSAGAAAWLQELTVHADATWLPFLHALQAIVGGSRDRALADHPELHYTMAAEILFLIETLERHGRR